jgi:hypothetical protein
MGALEALYASDMDAGMLARRAAEIAVAYDVSCGEPISVYSMALDRTTEDTSVVRSATEPAAHP